MSSLTLLGDTSGSVVLDAPAISGSTTLTLPARSGTVLTNNSMAVCYALNTSSTAFNNGVTTIVNFNTPRLDNFNGLNTSTYIYTVQAGCAGTYFVNAKIRFRQNSGGVTNQFITNIYKNGSSVAITELDGNGGISFWGYTVNNMWTGTLAVGDTIAVYGGVSTGTGSNTYYYPASDCCLEIRQIA
jgi:hypothetical protein